MRYATRISLVVLLCLLLVPWLLGIAVGEVSGPPKDYTLQIEDIVDVQVWGEQQLTTRQKIDPEGNIQLPYKSTTIHVEGMTLPQLVEKVKEVLHPIMTDPNITVSIFEFHRPKVFVLGQVYRPGMQEFKEGDRVMEAISEAGSFNESADLKAATITHKGENIAHPLDLYKLFYAGDMNVNIKLTAGDVIYIPEDTKNRFFVLGEVMRPSQYKLKEGMTLMDAISAAGGPTQRGSLKNASVIRGDTKGEAKSPQRIEVDLIKLLKKGDTSVNMALMPGDVVYIPESSKPDWNKISQFVTTIVNGGYLFRMLGL